MSPKTKKTLVGVLFVAPSVLSVLLMMVYPILQTFQFSFSKLTLPFFDAVFVGFDNFKKIFSDRDLGLIAKNTVIWTIGCLVMRMALGFGSALVFESKLKGMKILRTCALVPWVIPSIVAGNTWRWIFNADTGLLNAVLKMINPALCHNWLGDAKTAMGSVMVAYTWCGFPFVMLMLVAAMQGIPEDYKEAAKIDGANSWQVFRYITLPQLKNILMILSVLEFINGINSFDLLYLLTGGGPGISSETIGLTIYRYAFKNLDFAGASTLSMVVIGIVLIGYAIYAPLEAGGNGGKKKGRRKKVHA